MTWPPRLRTVRELKNRPTCAVCKVPVASFTEARDDFLLRVTFTARCHGATEQHAIDYATADRSGAITWGAAFAPVLALPAPAPSSEPTTDLALLLWARTCDA